MTRKMMTRSSQIGFAVAAMLALITAPAFATKTMFKAHLTGKNQVPAVAQQLGLCECGHGLSLPQSLER